MTALRAAADAGRQASLRVIALHPTSEQPLVHPTRLQHRYAVAQIWLARANGESEAAIGRKQAEMEKFEVMYQNPAINAAMTFVEPMPVGLIVALVSAGVLSRRKRDPAGEAA